MCIRDSVPAAFWSFAETWGSVFHQGVMDHSIKELCRVYVSRSVKCEYCGNQRSVKSAQAGLVEADYRDLLDFEERMDFRRLHRYRLGRTRQALSRSPLGSLLCFDQYNIRYITSTVIGNWARDKFTRYALLPGSAEPHLWDFGSAAKHHRLFAPWLPQHNLSLIHIC